MRTFMSLCHSAGCRSSRILSLPWLVAAVFVVLSLMAGEGSCFAQSKIPSSPGGRSSDAKSPSASAKKNYIKPHVKAWRMTDDYTQADTVVVDTILAEHQVNNPIWRKSVSCVTLGNYGSPAIATFYPAVRRDYGNVFYNAFKLQMLEQEDFTFYNTLTPYANLTYQKGIPKSEREEFFSVLFTQNVNRRLNLGVKMDITSCIGRFPSQGTTNFKMGFWSSYDGDIYKMQIQGWYQKYEIEENGGLTNDSIVLYPDLYDYDKTSDMPVQFMDAGNRLASYRLLWANSVDLGSVTRSEGDSIEYDVPVASFFYKFYADRSHHEFSIGDLSTYADEIDQLFPAVLNNPYYTYDKRKYMLVSNLLQVKLNEEFNSLLRFGLRAYIGNDVRQYYYDDRSEVVVDEETDESTLITHRQGLNRVSTYIGGQIFKNIGDRFKWNAGVRFVMQGYDAGDLQANGNLSFEIGNGRWRTGVWGKVDYSLRTPTLWEEHYESNHYEWNLNMDREQNLDISAGLRIPGVGLEVSAFSSTLSNRVYFGSDGTPNQKSDVTQVMGVYLREHLVQPKTGFNSIIRLALQKTSDNDVIPAPTFSLTATSYWERLFFGVLLTQIGFDVRFNTRYYSPAYIPALMQFVPQSERETGGYGYFDPFINFHLKKIRAYVKYEHVNYLWGSDDHFNTVHYASNPATFKFGLSWNFYD